MLHLAIGFRARVKVMIFVAKILTSRVISRRIRIIGGSLSICLIVNHFWFLSRLRLSRVGFIGMNFTVELLYS